MTKRNKATLVILQMEAVKQGDFEERTDDLLVLINEIMRDAGALAEEVLKEESKEDIAA